MEKYSEIVKSLIMRKSEEEWYEFKENWFEPYEIGTYISYRGINKGCRQKVLWHK